MTLAPVFRSPEAVKALYERGYVDRLQEGIQAHRVAWNTLTALLHEVIQEEFLLEETGEGDELSFLQENFFLVLFHSVFRTLECPSHRLELYTLLNFCIRGLVLSGDNIFDEEDKRVLPLRLGRGRRFASIVQLMCFQGLVDRVLALHGDGVEGGKKQRFRRDLLSSLTAIGRLEGSEEGGVDDVPPVREMIESVHRVRGGRLFSLAFIAPRIMEEERRPAWRTAEAGIRRLGTAFQIVDDLTDFEFDLGRGSHNLLTAEVVHGGSTEEQEILDRLRASPELREEGRWVERAFAPSAGRVLDHALEEAREGFRLLEEIGFWYPIGDAPLFVRAIAGDVGWERVQRIRSEPKAGRQAFHAGSGEA